MSAGLRPGPRWGSLQHSPRPLAGFKGPTYKKRGYRKGGEGGEEGEGRGEEEGEGGEGREGREGMGPPCVSLNFP